MSPLIIKQAPGNIGCFMVFRYFFINWPGPEHMPVQKMPLSPGEVSVSHLTFIFKTLTSHKRLCRSVQEGPPFCTMNSPLLSPAAPGSCSHGSFHGLIQSEDSRNPMLWLLDWTAAATAKFRQSCPTLCDPIDGSPPGSPVRGILQARTLQWVAISFSNAWEWKMKVKSLSRVRLLATPWTVAHQAPPSMGFSRQEYWSGVPLPSPLDWTSAG